MSNKKITFILYNINTSELDRKYNINKKSNIEENKFKKNVTQISDINNNNTQKYYIYLDEAKKQKKCLITMCDQLNNNLPKTTKLSCFWCRHPFDCSPIGCPIDFSNNKYITDGIFCSFNCCLSFILENVHNTLYIKSNKLLINIFKTLFDKTYIEPAPSWRLLKNYGGKYTIDEYRNLFYKIEYLSNDNYIDKIPKMYPIGWLYEERVKF
tara:strand:+ start:814 stop:1446 length:633 start_codon:yes stop_codon:yes gene_type:complete